jgi:hypothetical protein
MKWQGCKTQREIKVLQEDLNKQLDMTRSEDDPGNEDADLKQIVRNVSSVNNLGRTGNFRIDVQVAVLGHTLDVVQGNFRMAIFVTM